MSQATNNTMNLMELIQSLGMSKTYVAEKIGISKPTLYFGAIAKGVATEEQITQLADVLRVDRAQVEEALRENARRHELASSTGGKS